jgi:flagellar basal-body rod protein FlgF
MNESFIPSASSLTALGEQFRTISNNLANSSTAGFKRQIGSFTELLRKRMMYAGDRPSHVSEIEAHADFDFSQGVLMATGRKLDLAIQGEGFFEIETPEGSRYTRNGMFRVNDDGKLVDTLGRTVAGTSGPINLPKRVSLSQIAISGDGVITAEGKKVGQVKVVRFENPKELHPVGDSCFRVNEDVDPEEIDQPVVFQGYQETSNVSTTEELVDLMMVTRLYEANVKAIRKQDERMQSLLQVAM